MASTTQSSWRPIPFEKPSTIPASQPPVRQPDICASLPRTADRFALRQLGELVQKVYLTGHRGGHRHVAFASMDNTGMRPWLSARIGEILARQVAESVCLVEVDPNAGLSLELAPQYASPPISGSHDLTYKAGRNLWVCPADRFLKEDAWAPKSDLLRLRLSRLRREFGYLVVHAPPLGMSDAAVLLGQLTEGLVLVLEANLTRRVAAVRTSRRLRAAGVALLGTVLDQRSFPIPESIYRRV